MKEAILTDHGKIEIHTDCPMPVIQNPEDVIIRVRYCGINADDFASYTGRLGRIYSDRRLFHEISGEIYDLGSIATSLGFAKGDRVTRDPLHGCGYCPMCRRGLPHLCSENFVPGGSAEYVLYSAKSLVHLPDEISLEKGCLFWLFATCVRCVEKTQICPGSNVLILGGGASGLVLLQLIKKKLPASVVVVEPIASKRKTALELGADIVLDPAADSIEEVTLEITNGLGFDVVIDASGTCAADENITDVLGRGGKLMLFSNYGVDEQMTINLLEMYWKEYTIYSSFGATQAYYTSLDASILKNVDINSIIDQIMPLEEMEKALNMYGTGRYKRILLKL